MSDLLRNHIADLRPELLALLDAERAEHQKQISLAEVRISNLRAEHEETFEALCKEIAELHKCISEIRNLADSCLEGKTSKADVEILHEIISLIDEEEKP